MTQQSDPIGFKAMGSAVVELGLPDWTIGEYDRSDPRISRLGGEPSWLVPKRPTGLECSICSAKLYFLLQFYCPQSGFGLRNGGAGEYDRVLYVFVCNTKRCVLKSPSDAIKAIVQCRVAPSRRPKSQSGHVSCNFWEQVGPNLQDKSEDLKQTDYVRCNVAAFGGNVFPAIILKTVEELIRPKREDIESYGRMEDEDWSGEESHEDEPGALEDEVFDNFVETVSYYPKQCVRYSPNGIPLHFNQKYSGTSEVKPCSHCGCQMVFLAQLMPAILSLLPVDDYVLHIPETDRGKHTPFGDGAEFSTILIYQCPQCISSTSETECVISTEFEE